MATLCILLKTRFLITAVLKNHRYIRNPYRESWKGVRMRFERKQKEKELQEFLAREEELRIERKIKRLEGEVRRLRRELAAKEKEMEGISE